MTKKYKVRITNGAYDAPPIYVQADSDKQAIEEAKKKTRLSSFNNWTFIPKTR